MKIVCKVCGNEFDPLKNGGFCSQCGMKADEEDIAEAQKLSRVAGDTAKDMLKSYLDQSLNKAEKKPASRGKKVQIFLCSVLALATAAVFVYGNSVYKSTVKYYEQYTNAEDLPSESCSVNDRIALKDNYVIIMACRKMDVGEAAVSDGFKLVEVLYSTGEYENDLALSDAYLRCGDSCVKAVDLYDLRGVFNMETQEIEDKGYTSYIKARYGDFPKVRKLVFPAKEEDTDHTLILYDTSEDDNFQTKVLKKYTVELKEGS